MGRGVSLPMGTTLTQKGRLVDAHRRIRLALLVWVLGIVVVSLVPSTGVSFWNLDKIGHFLAYAGLPVLICLDFEGTKARLGALIGAVALGALLEWAHLYVPGRDMSFVDGTANALGVLAGAVVFRFRQGEFRRWATALDGRR